MIFTVSSLVGRGGSVAKRPGALDLGSAIAAVIVLFLPACPSETGDDILSGNCANASAASVRSDRYARNAANNPGRCRRYPHVIANCPDITGVMIRGLVTANMGCW